MHRITVVAFLTFFLSACASEPGLPANAPAGSPTPSAPAAKMAATPQPTPAIVTATAEETSLKAGGRGEAVVRLDIADGWHVNANPPSDKFYIGTEVRAEAEGGVTPGRPVYPRGLTKKFEFSEQPLAVYEGRTEVRLPLQVEASAAKGRRTVRARVRFQPCNDRECLQPSTVEADIPVNVS
jgi:DsbC/DsbD-like thiol-disulfide interchange protein